MNRRFEKLFEQPHNLYTEASPVIISAGVLLKDTETGNIIAQIKYQNIDSRFIKALKIFLQPFDTTGKKLDASVSFQYLDLNESRPRTFGSGHAILFPDIATRSFSIEIEEVIFEDNSVWLGKGKHWEPLPEPKPLQQILEDTSLKNQYCQDIGGDATYAPEKISDLWYCVCGSINHADESTCVKCNRELSYLQSALDIDLLKTNYEEAVKIAEAKKAKKIEMAKKGARILAIVLPIIIIISIAISFAMKAIKYGNAENAFENGNYETAISLYEELGDYRDSTSKCIDTKIYLQAINALNETDYEDALYRFEKIPNFADVPQKLEEVNAKLKDFYYDEAVAKMSSSHSEAKELFQKIPKNYKDSAHYLALIDEYAVLSGTYLPSKITTNYSYSSNEVLEVYGTSKDNIRAGFVTADATRNYIWWDDVSFDVVKNNDGTFTLSGTYEYLYESYPFDWTYKDGNMSANFKINNKPTVYFYKE